MAESNPLHPSRREIASGLVLGRVPDPPRARFRASPVEAGDDVPPGQRSGHRAADPTVRSGTPSPLAALESAVLPALCRPPCLVSFSGGLDSSLVLAVALRAARREGLPEPVPVTRRFTGAPRADESRWQDRIVRALGVADWQLLRADDELDLVGPVARRLLRRHGVRHPVNVHLHLPIVELAAGGSMLTGAGGDQVLGGWRRTPSGSVPTRLRRAASRLRAGWRDRRPTGGMFPWLHSDVSAELQRGYRAERRREPRRLDRRVAWHARRRDLRMTCASLADLGAEHAVTVLNPLLDDGFLAALTGPAGRRRCPSRAGLIAEIAAGELPEVVTVARPKARFLEVFLRAPTRRFVERWDGTGADEELVDVAALRALWARWPVPGGTAGLVQALWLATDSAGRARSEVPRPTGPEAYG